MNTASQLAWISALLGLIGLWLIVGPPFLFEAPFSDFWSDLIVGFALLALAIYTYARRTSASSQWAMAAATIFGGWLILSAFLWQTSTLLQYNDLLAGGIVAVLAGYSAYEARETYASNDSDESGDGDSDGSSGSSGSNGSGSSDDSSENSSGGTDSSDGENGENSENGEDGDDSESGDDSSNDESDDSNDGSNDG